MRLPTANVSRSENASHVVPCKHCKVDVKTSAWTCPNCGKRRWSEIVFFFALFLAMSAVGVYRLSDNGSSVWWLPTIIGGILLVLGIHAMIAAGIGHKRKEEPARQQPAGVAAITSPISPLTPLAHPSAEPTAQKVQTTIRPQQVRTPEKAMSLSGAEEGIIEIARRTVPRDPELSYYFICTGNQSLINAYHNVFRVGAPAYGGSAACYRVDKGQLSARMAAATAASLLFVGQRSMGSTVEEVSNVSDVLAGLGVSAHGSVFISFVSVGPAGQDWVRKAYNTLLGEAVGQGILPFSMYTTANKDAAQFLIDSLSVVFRG
jgi:hypothetical protein